MERWQWQVSYIMFSSVRYSKDLRHENYQNSNRVNRHETEWNIKMTGQNLKRIINTTQHIQKDVQMDKLEED